MHSKQNLSPSLLKSIIENIKKSTNSEKEAEIKRLIELIEDGVTRDLLPETISSLYLVGTMGTSHSTQLEKLRFRFILAEWIYEKRNKLGYVIKQVEELSGVNRGYISRLERGIAKLPSADIIQKLSNVLGELPDELQNIVPTERVENTTYNNLDGKAVRIATLVNDLPAEYQEWLAQLTEVTSQWVKETYSQDLQIMGLSWEKAGTTKQKTITQIVQFLLKLDQKIIHQILGELFSNYVEHVDSEDVPSILRMFTRDTQTVPAEEKFDFTKTKTDKEDD